MPRTLITGAAGFLGSHLSDRFVALGHHVVGMDNFVTGRRENLAHLEDHDRFELVEHDISTHIDVDGPLDYILNFASPASPIQYLELPIRTMKVAALGTLNGLGLARVKGARFLQASTSEVYGDPLEHPQAESYWGNVNPVGPRAVYDEGKRYAESLCMAYHRIHDIETRIVRIFNTYGPRMALDDGRVVPTFVAQALRGETLTMFGDGTQTRAFCYVDDLIRGIESLLFSDEFMPVNIGNPDEFTMLELAQRVIDHIDPSLKIEHHPLPEGDPKVRRPDLTRAREILGWAPAVSLAEGLPITIDALREDLGL